MIADMHVRPDRSPSGIDGGLMPVDDLIYLAPLRQLAEVLLRGDSTLSRSEGELIVAYVSWLNECQFCQRSHDTFAAFQLEGSWSVVDAVKRDPRAAPVTEKMKALLAIAATVQQGGRSVTSG